MSMARHKHRFTVHLEVPDEAMTLISKQLKGGKEYVASYMAGAISDWYGQASPDDPIRDVMDEATITVGYFEGGEELSVVSYGYEKAREVRRQHLLAAATSIAEEN